MQKGINKGFTLIELLVVIAIIGILAAIVLVSLGNARQKGADAGIQGNLDSIRTQAEVYASNNSNAYNPTAAIGALGAASQIKANVAGAGCGIAADMWTDTTINQAIINASNNAGTATLAGTASAASVCLWGGANVAAKGATYWLVAVPLKSDPTKAWCVDSSGKAQQSTVANMTSLALAQALTSCPN